MSYIRYKNNNLFMENVSVRRLASKFSTPFYPETNGQVERLHGWIKERLTLISVELGMNFIDYEDDWDNYISLIQHSYNSTPNSITSYSPNHIIFGQDLKVLRGIT